MTRTRERMRDWLSKKKAKLQTKLSRKTASPAPTAAVQDHAPASNPLAPLPQEMRDHIFDFLAPGMYIRRSRFVFDRLGRLYSKSSPPSMVFGGEGAGLLEVNRQYREEFTQRIQAANITHHHIHVLVDLDDCASMANFEPSDDTDGLVAAGASHLTIWVTLRRRDGEIKWTEPAELESAKLYDMLITYIDAYRPFNDSVHLQQVVVFLKFEGPPSASNGFRSRMRSNLYWWMALRRLVRELKPHVDDVVFWNTGDNRDLMLERLSTAWNEDRTIIDADGNSILPPVYGGITVFTQDPGSRRMLVHFRFRPEVMRLSAQVQQAHQIRREQVREVKRLKKRLAAMRRREALLQMQIWWINFKLLGHGERE